MYEAWCDLAGWNLGARNPPRFKGRVKIALTFGEKGTRADLDNLCKPVLDLLVASGVIPGDSKKYVREILLCWGDGRHLSILITDDE